MADSKEQQTALTEACAFGQDDVRNLHLGLLLFSNKDFYAIKDTLLPEKKVEDIMQFYCSNYTYTKAHSLVHKLEHSGFQPGALVSGNMRNRVLSKLSSATARTLRYDKALSAAFKAYDACSMPLLDLVEVLTGAVGAGALGKAIYEELGTTGLDMEQLTLSDLHLDWDILEEKLKARSSFFNSALWPALEVAGWKHGPVAEAATTHSTGAALQQDAGEPASDAIASVKKDPSSANDKVDGSRAAQAEGQLYMPPAAVAAKYLASVGEPVPPCYTPEDIIDALRETGQPVPASCIISIREAELVDSLQHLSQVSQGLDAPHRHTHDPAAKRPSTPITSRKFMCANCSISTSTVWRTGNAGLTLCNACGMFYNKHDHEHRPEHLIASARAKAEAQQQAAAAAAASGSPLHKMRHGGGLRSYTPDGNTDGEMSDDARRGGCMAGSESGDDEEEGGRRPRTRRRAQVNKWLASDDYLMLDGPLRTSTNPGMGWSVPQASGYAGFAAMHDDARSYDGQRRNTASPYFGSSYRRCGQQQHKSSYGSYGGRSRSMDPEFYPSQQERWQEAGAYAGSRLHVQDKAGHMDWEDGEGAAGYADEVDQNEWRQEMEDRPLEDMESLLGRILINSPSDASDSSAADALVAMSQTCISQHEQHLLHAAISCDIRAASASPGPTSVLRRTVAVAAAAAAVALGDVYSPTKSGLGRAELFAASRAAAAITSPQEVEHLDQGQQQQEQQSEEEESADDADDAGSGMGVDHDNAAEQHEQGIYADAEVQAEQEPQVEQASMVGFAEAWARVQALAGLGSDSGRHATRAHSAFGGDEMAPCLDGTAAWLDAANQSVLQHCHSGPNLYDEQLAAEMAAGAAGSGSYGYASSSGAHGSQYFQEELGTRCLSGSHGSMPELLGYDDSGSRSASPTKAGRSRRQNHNIDEDYQEKPSKNKSRSISRFGAEHKQQMDYTAVFSSPVGAPKKSPQRAVRRTSTGEPVRCANCRSDSTCLWRRDKEDATRTLCNACGIYKTNNGIDRPTNGLFPFWKNGKERVVRRNTARPIFKPYKHCVFTPEEYMQQLQQDYMKHTSSHGKSSSRSTVDRQQLTAEPQQFVQQDLQAAGEIHPGALGFPADVPLPSEPLQEFSSFETPAGQLLSSIDLEHAVEDPAALAALPAATPNASSAPAATNSQSSANEAQEQLSAAAAVISSNPVALAAAVAAAQAAAAARVRGSLSDQLNQADDGPAQALAPGAWTAAVVAAAASGTAAGSAPPPPSTTAAGTAGSSAAAAGSPAPEMIGWVQQMSEVGVLGQFLHEAYTHAVQLQEPVMLPSGHKVHPDGRVIKCQVNNELGLMLPAGSQELAATVARVAAAISSGSVPSGLGPSGAPPKVTFPGVGKAAERLPAGLAAATAAASGLQ